MFTATLFKSEYRDAQGQWHNSRHDRRYITNILGGKEYTSLTFPNIAYRIEYGKTRHRWCDGCMFIKKMG